MEVPIQIASLKTSMNVSPVKGDCHAVAAVTIGIFLTAL
jgi:hypothetical protein